MAAISNSTVYIFKMHGNTVISMQWEVLAMIRFLDWAHLRDNRFP